LLRPLSQLSRRAKLFACLAGLCAMGGGIAVAQSVDGIDIDRIMSAADRGNPDAEALAREVAARAEALRSEAEAAARDGQDNMERNAGGLGGPSSGPVDFDELLSTSVENQTDRGRAPFLIVFASLSMPEDSLKRLIRDTSKAGGMVVFNGFPGNSMKAFQQGILKVVENNSDYGNVGIDPRLFRAFKVTAVPTVVVVTSDFDPCDGFDCSTQLPPFDRMSGNVPLDYVLETFASGNGPGASIARQALSRLHNGGV